MTSLPIGYVIETNEPPSPEDLNRLLSRCKQLTHPPDRLASALRRSVFHISIVEEATGDLAGFVRVTSDYGLNANLWNLAAKPGVIQEQLISILIHKSLLRLRRDFAGCSISVYSSGVTLNVLRNQGFLINPNGIRVMGYKLKKKPGRIWNFGFRKTTRP